MIKQATTRQLQSHGISQVVVVVGASSGIGREIALRYAARHARLVLASRSEETLQRVAEECRTAGAAGVVVQTTDIAEADQVQRLFDDTVARFGRIDIATQCAAILRATDRPRSSERQVGWMNRPAIAVYRVLPTVFDALIGPLLRTVSFTSGPTESTAGNVFDPAAGLPRR